MTSPKDRRPPADPWLISLDYRRTRPWWYDAEDAVTRWTVTADVEDDDGHPGDHVADIAIVVVEPDRTRDPISLLDGEDGDLGLVAETIFDIGSGDLDPDFDDLLEAAGSQILVLNRVELTAAWRGFGLGALLAGSALRELSAGARAAVCYPAPIGGDAEEQTDPFSRRRAVASLERVWAGLGFVPFRNGIHVLDLGLVTLEESLAKLRAQAEAYRAR